MSDDEFRDELGELNAKKPSKVTTRRGSKATESGRLIIKRNLTIRTIKKVKEAIEKEQSLDGPWSKNQVLEKKRKLDNAEVILTSILDTLAYEHQDDKNYAEVLQDDETDKLIEELRIKLNDRLESCGRQNDSAAGNL